jgi:septum formation protein
VNEAPRAAEAPRELALRLAWEKAAVVAARNPDAWVIGADQVAVCRDRIVGKPGDAARAIEQLTAASSQAMCFYTAVCLARGGEERDEYVDETRVHFRALTPAEIARYVERDRPFDCAGSFRSEGLGITLFERVESTDPTALIGLPLIWLSGALRRAGLL